MAVEVLDGTFEPAEPVHRKGKYARFDTLKFTSSAGESRSFPKVASAEPVTAQMIAGGPGRYYMVRAEGAYGLVGVRRPDGSAYYAHYSNIEMLLLVVGLIGTAAGIARIGFAVEGLPLLPAILGPLLLLAWVYLRSQRLVAKRVFDADA